uniref:Uncharacterized protein n=1 Tax=Panagrolaimus superbus TaxID=310955 RepID=A0A914Y9L9_9BILA
MIAITIELFSILWSIIGFCSCRCCKECFHFALPGLSTAASAFLIAILIVFGINNSHAIEDFVKIYNIKLPKRATITNEISYSYYITVGALIFNFIAVGIGIFVSLWNHETNRAPWPPLKYKNSSEISLKKTNKKVNFKGINL